MHKHYCYWHSHWMLCCVLIGGLAYSMASKSEIKDEPCGVSTVAAYVSVVAKNCFVTRNELQVSPRKKLVLNSVLYAGDRIRCTGKGEVGITFCRSRADQRVRRKDAPEYIVPNVPQQIKQDTADRPAARIAIVIKDDDSTYIVPEFPGTEHAADKPLVAVSTSPGVPTCEHKLGTLAVTEPENKWWVPLNLESPEALIKVFVAQSKCFTLVDRGKGLAAAQAERAIAGVGEMRGGSNIGNGQMKSADYVLIPDIINKNANSGGKSFGGLVGGMIGGVAGATGGLSLKSKTADVVLTLTDVRSTEQVSLQEGYAKKTDLGWGAGGGAFFGGFATAGASGYANTEIGQVVTKAYLDAYIKLVEDVKQIQPDAKANNVRQAVTMAEPGKMYDTADVKGKLIRDLESGMTLYPTGEKEGIWWKVQDELGNEGWVPSTLFSLAQ